MGLDITILEYKGIAELGYLIMKTPAVDLPYTTDRVAIRKELSKHIKFEVLSAGDDYGEYYRPKDFDKAYEWCYSLEDPGEVQYVKGLLDSLKMNDNYWLSYSY